MTHRKCLVERRGSKTRSGFCTLLDFTKSKWLDFLFFVLELMMPPGWRMKSTECISESSWGDLKVKLLEAGSHVGALRLNKNVDSYRLLRDIILFMQWVRPCKQSLLQMNVLVQSYHCYITFNSQHWILESGGHKQQVLTVKPHSTCETARLCPMKAGASLKLSPDSNDFKDDREAGWVVGGGGWGFHRTAVFSEGGGWSDFWSYSDVRVNRSSLITSLRQV